MLRRLLALALLLLALQPLSAAESPYRVDHAAPLDATEKPLDPGETFTLLRVEFNGIAGDRVPGHLYLPKNLKGRAPAILVQHGIGDKKQAEYIVKTCRLLAARGVIALGIDAPQRGERKNLPGQEKISMLDPASVHKWFRQHCGDYSRAFDYLATRADVDPGQFGYIGFSWGAITGITYAAHDERIKAMASLVGGGNLVGILGVPPAPGEGKKGPPSLDPAHNVAAFAPRPLRFVNARQDTIIFPPFAEALHKAAGAGSSVEWHDTDHYFHGMDLDKILGGVADFMKSKLEGTK